MTGDVARPQQHDPIGVGVRLIQVVGRENHGATAGGLGPDRFPESPTSLDVESGGRFVKDNKIRMGNQCHGEPHPLLLPSGQVRHSPLGKISDIRSSQGLFHCERPTVEGSDHPYALRDGQVRQQATRLENSPDLAPPDRFSG